MNHMKVLYRILKILLAGGVAAMAVSSCRNVAYNGATGDIVLETETFRLVIDSTASAKSLVVKGGEEMLDITDRVTLFSVTQTRPFNNETKLEHPNTRTEYPANHARMEGGKLIVGFDGAPYEAQIGLSQGRGYIVFTLEDFICDHDRDYEGLRMNVPPVSQFRIMQLPVREKEYFGEWLNVMWDSGSAVCVAGCDPYAEIWHEDRNGYKLLTADVFSGMKLRGGAAAIIAGKGREDFLDVMDGFEKDLGLPHGVESRRSPKLNRSIYWTSDATPENIDWHIATAKKCGMEMMLFYYTCFIKSNGYTLLGNYDLRDEYPGGYDGIREMLDKVKAAGITPGFHTLQTHIGIASRYVTPSVDSRLNLTRRFTLKEPLPASGEINEITVEENPVDAPMYDGTRVLTFGGEAFSYEGFTTERPYRFTGVRRGHYSTRPTAHPRGEAGGTLDISEYGAKSIYINQDTDLQDEIAEKIASIYDCGFEFFYLDGSEGVNPPCGINVSLSQYRVVSKCRTMPLFTEGAAKTHFGWHQQAGANAFDVFGPDVFLDMIRKHPLAESVRMRQDMTRVDFGWWRMFPETTPEMWNIADSLAASVGCPVTIQFRERDVNANDRAEELFAVLRKWEDRRRGEN